MARQKTSGYMGSAGAERMIWTPLLLEAACHRWLRGVSLCDDDDDKLKVEEMMCMFEAFVGAAAFTPSLKNCTFGLHELRTLRRHLEEVAILDPSLFQTKLWPALTKSVLSRVNSTNRCDEFASPEEKLLWIRIASRFLGQIGDVLDFSLSISLYLPW